MTLVLLVVLAPAHLEDVDLVAAAHADDGGLDCRVLEQGLADGQRLAIGDHQHLVQCDFVADGDRLSVLRLDGPECRVAGAAPVAPGLLRAWLDDLPGGALWRFDPDAPSVDQIAWTTDRVRRLVFERIDA
jgi:hypothetical protein